MNYATATIELKVTIKCNNCDSELEANYYDESKAISQKILEIGATKELDEGIFFICPSCFRKIEIKTIECDS